MDCACDYEKWMTYPSDSGESVSSSYGDASSIASDDSTECECVDCCWYSDSDYDFYAFEPCKRSRSKVVEEPCKVEEPSFYKLRDPHYHNFGASSWVGAVDVKYWFGLSHVIDEKCYEFKTRLWRPIGATPCVEGGEPKKCYKDINEELETIKFGLQNWNLTPEERAEFESNDFGLIIEPRFIIEPQKELVLELVRMSPMYNDTRIPYETWKLLPREYSSYPSACFANCLYCPKLRPCSTCKERIEWCENCFYEKKCHHYSPAYKQLCPRHAYEIWKVVVRAIQEEEMNKC